MTAARAWGVPRSIFLGRPMPAPGEPLWTEEDRAWAIALVTVEAEACPDCGNPWSETSSADNEFSYRAELVRCHACATSAKAVAAFEHNRGDAAGMHVLVHKR